MNSFRLARPTRLHIVFSLAVIMNVLGLVVFGFHCDSPNSWVCAFEYIGLPGLLLAFVVPVPSELGDVYAGTIVVSILVLSFLAWSWIAERALMLLLRRSAKRANPAAV